MPRFMNVPCSANDYLYLQLKFVKIHLKLICILIYLSVVSQSVHGQVTPSVNDPQKNPNTINKIRVSHLQGKPIQFYLDHEGINSVAKRFYRGEFAVSDDEQSFSIAGDLMKAPTETRPFYFFVVNRMIDLSDGALSEFLAEFCAAYLKQSSCEFIAWSEDKTYSVDKNKWAGFVAFTLDNENAIDEYRRPVELSIRNNCPEKIGAWNYFIKLFRGKTNQN